MKKAILALAALVATAASYGQGTVQFNNRLPASGIDAKVLDGVTGLGVSDPSFKAQIYAGLEGISISSLTPVFPPTNFRTGFAAGYVNPIDLTIPGIAPGARATIVLRVYNGPTFESSTVFGTSALITITLGGVGTPPGPGAELIGLTSFVINFPEPSTVTLGLLRAAILLWRWRR